MKRALREEKSPRPRSEVKDVFCRSTPRSRRRELCRRHVASPQSSRSVPSRKTDAEDGSILGECVQGREVFQLNFPAKEDGTRTRQAENEQYSCKAPDGEITEAASNGKSKSFSLHLRSLDSHSPKELTISSFDDFTTASGSRLSHGEAEQANMGGTAVFHNGTGKNNIQVDKDNNVEWRLAREFSGKALSRGAETARKRVLPETFRRGSPRAVNKCHSHVAKSSSSKKSLLTEESLTVSYTKRQPSISKATSRTRDDRPPVSASEGLLNPQPDTAVPQYNHILGVTKSKRCALLVTGPQSVDVTARDEGGITNHEQWVCPARNIARQAACTIGRTRRAPCRENSRGSSETSEGSSETAVYPPSSIEQESGSDTTADCLSWVDYPLEGIHADAPKRMCYRRKSAYCHQVGDRALLSNMMELNQAPQVGSHHGERLGSRSADTDGSYYNMSSLSDRDRVAEEKTESREEHGHSSRDEFGTPVAYVCGSEYTTFLGNDKHASHMEGLLDTQREHQRSDGWKARLNLSRSHSRREVSGCEHDIRVSTTRYRAPQKNISKKVSQTLRRKMGEAVSRLRRKRAPASVKQQRPETWLHSSRETSNTSPHDVAGPCPRKIPPLCTGDAHQNHRTLRSENLFDSQTLRKYKTPWDASGSADVNRAIHIEEKPSAERDGLFAFRPPSNTWSTNGARDQIVAQLHRARPTSALVDEPANDGYNARRRRTQPPSASCESEVGECDVGDCPAALLSNCSVESVRRLMRVDCLSAGTTLSTSSVSSEKRFEGYCLPEGVQPHRQKTPGYALETQQEVEIIKEARTSELRKSSYDTLTGEVEAGSRLSGRLSDAVTQASSNHLHNCAAIRKDGGTNPPKEAFRARYAQSQVDKLLTLDNTQPALESISGSQSPDSGSIQTGDFQCSTARRVHDTGTAITFNDIETSIEWIIEASSNPKLLRVARDLLVKRTNAERNTARKCYRCAADNPPAHYAESDPCIYPSTDVGFYVNTESRLPSQTISQDRSVYSSTSSGRPSFYYQGRRLKVTKKGSHFGADKGLPSFSACAMETTKVCKGKRRIHERKARSRSCTSKLECQYQRLNRRNVNGHRKCSHMYEEDCIRKVSLCYASSDVAWNTDQLI